MIKKNKAAKTLIVFFSLLILFWGCAVVVKQNTEIPQPYVNVLEKYKTVTACVTQDIFEKKYNNGEFDLILGNDEQEYKWKAMIADLKVSQHDEFGYILKDVNCDGTSELFLVRGDYSLLAIFTIFDNEPVLLDAFWSKNKGFMLDTDEIYVLTSGGAQDFEYAFKKISTSGNKLECAMSFGCRNGTFYKKTKEQSTIISSKDFESLLRMFPMINGKNWYENSIVRI